MFKKKFTLIVFFIAIISGCTKPARLEISPEKVILEGAGSHKQFSAKVLSDKGEPITEGVNIVWFSDDTSIIKLDQDGKVTAVSSGEATVTIELVGYDDLKAEAFVRVKIPSSIEVSHERLRLWIGQIKENVNATVRSEKGAFIEDYMAKWYSDNPEIVKVENINDPARRQSFVKMTGLKSGTTYIYARFKGLSKKIRVAVFDENEEIAADGTRIPKKEK